MDPPGFPSGRRQIAVVAVLVVLAAIAVLIFSGVLSVSFSLMGPAGDTPPQGSFYINGAGHNVTISHDVGGPVNASNLQIRVDGEVRGTWRNLSNGSTRVEVGDEITLHGVDPDATVALYWTGGNDPKKLVSQNG